MLRAFLLTTSFGNCTFRLWEIVGQPSKGLSNISLFNVLNIFEIFFSIYFCIFYVNFRDLPDGDLELGVHIADVTHFVEPLSKVDLEAKSRSTSIYMPDRRYDMLPHVLSGNLCSLLGNVDRYVLKMFEIFSSVKLFFKW